MRVLNYPAFDQLEIREQDVASPKPDEVRLKVAACGVCGSELESFKNHSPRRPPPLVMGHEFCGTVAELGTDVTSVKIGARVVSNSLVPCGKCVRCTRGDTHLCAHRQIFGMHRPGAFAEYVNVPARCLIPWPENLPAEAASLAEPLANGIHIVNLTKNYPAATVLVIGAGPIGLFSQQALQVLRGELSAKDAIFYAKRDTRHYAKRQMTWFRQEPGIEIFRGFGDDPAVERAVEQRVAEFLGAAA